MAVRTTTQHASTGDLSALRNILLGAERDDIDALKERLDDPALHAQDVSRVLAEAIVLRSGDGDALTEAFMPVVVEALKLAIEREPQAVAEALEPLIGPATRGSTRSAFRDFAATKRRGLEEALSPRRLRWRWQAIQTRQPFSEIVLLHTLVYRVDEVVLVHDNSGLPLLHAAGPRVRSPMPIAQIVSAINSVARDSTAAPEGSLGRLEVGGRMIFVEAGSRAAIGAVVRGVANEQLRSRLQVVLDSIHEGYDDQLRRYRVEPGEFEGARPLLETCLMSELRDY